MPTRNKYIDISEYSFIISQFINWNMLQLILLKQQISSGRIIFCKNPISHFLPFLYNYALCCYSIYCLNIYLKIYFQQQTFYSLAKKTATLSTFTGCQVYSIKAYMYVIKIPARNTRTGLHLGNQPTICFMTSQVLSLQISNFPAVYWELREHCTLHWSANWAGHSFKLYFYSVHFYSYLCDDKHMCKQILTYIHTWLHSYIYTCIHACIRMTGNKVALVQTCCHHDLKVTVKEELDNHAYEHM